MPWCSLCETHKPKNEFWRHPTTATRFNPWCKSCHNDWSRGRRRLLAVQQVCSEGFRRQEAISLELLDDIADVRLTPEERIIGGDACSEILALLAKRDYTLSVVALLIGEGMLYEDIARMLGHEGTVEALKMWTARRLARIREILAENGVGRGYGRRRRKIYA